MLSRIVLVAIAFKKKYVNNSVVNNHNLISLILYISFWRRKLTDVLDVGVWVSV